MIADELYGKPNQRWLANKVATALMTTAMILVAIPLVAVIYAVVSRGAGAVLTEFPAFLIDEIPPISRRAGAGMGPAIVGTLLATGAATVIAVPLGVMGAVYLHEYGGQGAFARVVRFLAVVMTGVPSIVMGMFVYVIWTLRFGYSAFGGALGLACLMLPVVVGSTEQMLRLVPQHLREAAYALGASKSRTILTVVLPAALPGIVSGSLLAISRAAGETAPLLFAVGAAKTFNLDLFDGANTALSLQIFQANSDLAFPAAEQRAWGAALTLVGLAFTLNLVARLVTTRALQRR
jgi:phosphate transport system permease protein